jgi:hypothetical protein
MHNTIIDYEHMPRYTQRSDQFQRIGGRWEAVSTPEAKMDGAVSKPLARAYMQDLLAYLERPEARALFRKRRATWRGLRKMLERGNYEELTKRLAKLVATSDPMQTAIVRDFLDWAPDGVKWGETGLKPIASAAFSPNKFMLIKQYPSWAPILKDPGPGIAQLLAAGDWTTLGAITDVLVDDEFDRLLMKALFEGEMTPRKISFLENILETEMPDRIGALGEALYAEKAKSIQLEGLWQKYVQRLEVLMREGSDAMNRRAVGIYVNQMDNFPDDMIFRSVMPVLRKGNQFRRQDMNKLLHKKEALPKELWQELLDELSDDAMAMEDVLETIKGRKDWPAEAWPKVAQFINDDSLFVRLKAIDAIVSQDTWPSFLFKEVGEAIRAKSSAGERFIYSMTKNPPKFEREIPADFFAVLPPDLQNHYRSAVVTTCPKAFSALKGASP